MEKSNKPQFKTVYFIINGEQIQVKGYHVSTIAECATTALRISGAKEVDIEKFEVKTDTLELVDKHKEILGNYDDSECFRIEEIQAEGYVPTQLKKPNFEAIRNQASECIDFIASKEYNSDQLGDHKQYIFEVVMTGLYGEDVFTWINKQKG